MNQLKSTLLAFAAIVALVFILFMTVNKSPMGNENLRGAAFNNQEEEGKEYPRGHEYTEKEELWHLSEGADFMPLRWFLNIKSTHSNEKVTKGTYLYNSLGDKFGVVEIDRVKRDYYGDKSWSSPMKWVGLTLAWSEPTSQIPDEGTFQAIKDESANVKPKTDTEAFNVLSQIDAQGAKPVSGSKFGGKFEVPMVGTNCALCHSNQMKFKDQQGQVNHSAFVEGAPNMLNVRNMFKDFGGGVLKTMLDPKLMTEYLVLLDKKKLIELETVAAVPNLDAPKVNGIHAVGSGKYPMVEITLTKEQSAKRKATEFIDAFKKDLEGVADFKLEEIDGIVGLVVGGLRRVKTKLGMMDKEKEVGSVKEGVMKRALGFKENRSVLAEYYGRFFALSYGLSYEEDVLKTPALKKRFTWLAKVVTPDPKLPMTPEGYGRTDAFGRISNMVARLDKELPLIAPVSFPPMWGMKYSNLFHFNGNTNSVIMRNIGQSFGLGALVFTEEDGLSAEGGPLVTSNIYNLNRLEKHLYNIKYPEWNTLVPKHLQIDTTRSDHFQAVERGCNVYIKKCMWCHDDGKRVGPGGEEDKKLVHHQVFSLQMAGTDPNHTMVQPTPVTTAGYDKPFRQALFELTKLVKKRYMAEMGVSESRMSVWENRSFRGQEHFRDTFLGENFTSRGGRGEWLRDFFGIEPPENYRSEYDLKYMALADTKTGEPVEKKYGYIAKSLAGIWATAPYLHNGSVPTLEHLLNPKKTRPKNFYVGCRVYDPKNMGYVWTPDQYKDVGCEASDDHLFEVDYKLPRKVFLNKEVHWTQFRYGPECFDEDGTYTCDLQNGNSNVGHSWDNRSDIMIKKAVEVGFISEEQAKKIKFMSEEDNPLPSMVVKNDKDRKALLTFLKVLQPSNEYAWHSEAPYEISADGKSCKAIKVEPSVSTQ